MVLRSFRFPRSGSSSTTSKAIAFSFLAISVMMSTTSSKTTSMTSALASSGTAVSQVVPEYMQLSSIMKNTNSWLNKAQLIPIDFDQKSFLGDGETNIVKEKDLLLKGNEVVQRNMGKYGSIAFIVRRPGWVLCREHGQQLTELHNAATTTTTNDEDDDEGLNGFDLFGIIKETGVDDAGLLDFYNDHYTYPIYRDINLNFYQSFGIKAKITDHISWSTIFNPFKAYQGIQKMNERMTSKKLKGNLIGEGLKTGGIIIFGTDGQPKYAYPEITGQELNIKDLLCAIQSVRRTSIGDGNEKSGSGDNTNEL